VGTKEASDRSLTSCKVSITRVWWSLDGRIDATKLAMHALMSGSVTQMWCIRIYKMHRIEHLLDWLRRVNVTLTMIDNRDIAQT